MKGSRTVKVTYQNRQTPITSIQEAIARQNFFPKQLDDVVVGDAESECLIDLVQFPGPPLRARFNFNPNEDK